MAGKGSGECGNFLANEFIRGCPANFDVGDVFRGEKGERCTEKSVDEGVDGKQQQAENKQGARFAAAKKIDEEGAEGMAAFREKRKPNWVVED